MTRNAIQDLNGNQIIVTAIDEAYLTHVTIVREDRTFTGINLTPDDVVRLVELLSAASECAACGHDAVPEHVGDNLHYECRRCGAAWDETP